jgi:hypothetical protein
MRFKLVICTWWFLGDHKQRLSFVWPLIEIVEIFLVVGKMDLSTRRTVISTPVQSLKWGSLLLSHLINSVANLCIIYEMPPRNSYYNWHELISYNYKLTSFTLLAKRYHNKNRTCRVFQKVSFTWGLSGGRKLLRHYLNPYTGVAKREEEKDGVGAWFTPSRP